MKLPLADKNSVLNLFNSISLNFLNFLWKDGFDPFSGGKNWTIKLKNSTAIILFVAMAG